jgi:hypothetical protein
MMKRIFTALSAVALAAAQAEVAGQGHDATPQVEPEPASHGHDSVGTFCFINNFHRICHHFKYDIFLPKQTKN